MPSPTESSDSQQKGTISKYFIKGHYTELETQGLAFFTGLVLPSPSAKEK
jgi:hypothetical protein